MKTQGTVITAAITGSRIMRGWRSYSPHPWFEEIADLLIALFTIPHFTAGFPLTYKTARHYIKLLKTILHPILNLSNPEFSNNPAIDGSVSCDMRFRGNGCEIRMVF